MNKFTLEQQRAIDEEGTNIIVSAGAGSGKTAVLTQRVIRKIKDGVDINKLLVLTFTKAAAHEMKERIRVSLTKENLTEALEYLESSYITTFDSYALSVVKKYFYLLNISKNVSIMDSSIVKVYKTKIIDKIFEKRYELDSFKNLMNLYTVKDDTNIKKLIISISDKMDLLVSKEDYQKNYIKNYYSEKEIDKTIKLYETEILDRFSSFKNEFDNLKSITEEKYSSSLSNTYDLVLEDESYENLKVINTLKFPPLPKNSSDEVKESKAKCVLLLKEIDNFTRFESLTEIKNLILSTKDYSKEIIEIIKLIDIEVNDFKRKFDRYEFNDIALLAIKVVKENPDIRKELQDNYNEIMIDEYQDTSDLQEEFINLISKNNVYVVGDVKQSIYRFRSANPYLFRNKYDSYEKKSNGKKIDLLKNFRSRKEVIEDINKIFNRIMTFSLGDAAYEENHNMIFGNEDYEKNLKTDNNLEIFTYEDKESDELKEEIEAFFVANDIKNKIKSNYQIYDKETKILRNATYEDFTILMDRSGNFNLYKKIFEYLNLPLSVKKEEVLTEENELLVIKNIINLLLKIKEKKYNKEFRYYMTSILRSFIYKESDEYIFSLFKNNSFYDSSLFEKLNTISKNLEEVTSYELIQIIYKEFQIYQKVLGLVDVEASLIKLDYILELAHSLGDYGYTLNDFVQYLNQMLESKIEIKYNTNDNLNNSIKLMSIHKSKGLEFPVCYYTGLYKLFTKQELKDMFLFDETFGIILPFITDVYNDNIIKDLLKIKNNKEDISEKIRLLYVSLTRAREKMIIVMPSSEVEENNSNIVSDDVKIKYNSFMSMINSIKSSLTSNIKEIDLKDLNISKDYNIVNSSKTLNKIKKTDKLIEKYTNDIEYSEVLNKRFSKESSKLITLEERETMDYGTKAHYILETTDFSNPDNEYARFLIKEIPDLTNATIYKEYEFMYRDSKTQRHGIIDLLIEYENEIYIIDYKLNNIEDKNYINQLNGYKDYIKTINDKKISIYLYSIILKTLKKIE